MATTSWKTVGTATWTDNGDGRNWGEFGNPTWETANVNSADGTYAYGFVSNTNGTDSEYAQAYNFGFTVSDVPADATIDGVEFRFSGCRSANGNRYVRFKNAHLLKDGVTGTPVGTSQADQTEFERNTPITITHGSSISLWGTTITPAEVIDSDFGVTFQVERYTTVGGTGSTAAEIDGPVEMRVHYTPAGGGSTNLTPTGSGATGTVGSPALTAEVSVTPTGLTSSGTLEQPTVTPSSEALSPTGLTSSGTVGSPTAAPEVSLSPTGLVASGVVAAASIVAKAAISPTGLAASGLIGALTLTSAVTLAPQGLASTGTVSGPTITAAVDTNPTGLSSQGSLDQPTATGSGTLAPQGLASTGTVSGPTITAAVDTNPTGLSSQGSLDQPTVSAIGETIDTPTTRTVSLSGEVRTSTIEGESRVAGNSNSWPDKDPDDVLDYAIDWSSFLGDSETLTSSAWDISPSGELSSSDLVQTNDKTGLTLSGGVANKTYKIRNRVTTSAGNTVDRTVTLVVRER